MSLFDGNCDYPKCNNPVAESEKKYVFGTRYCEYHLNEFNEIYNLKDGFMFVFFPNGLQGALNTIIENFLLILTISLMSPIILSFITCAICGRTDIGIGMGFIIIFLTFLLLPMVVHINTINRAN
jgi:cellulose synthase/poly-beta-1,6-N-acetylglucosamine synthase-like glycosyltransferase